MEGVILMDSALIDALKQEKEECEPCGYVIAAGMIINQLCSLTCPIENHNDNNCKETKEKCEELKNSFVSGELSLRELADKLNDTGEYLELFKSEGLDIDAKTNFEEFFNEEDKKGGD